MKDDHWLVRPATIRKMWIFGIAFLVLLTLADLTFKGYSNFWIDGTFGFYSWYGFITCAAMVIGAKALGIFLKRGDDYYDR